MPLVNGEARDQLSLQDRGLQYGDGLFETMAAVRGSVRFLERHLDRLEWGCERLGFTAPPREVLRAEIETLLSQTGRAVIKLIVTRGAGERGYRPDPAARPTRILTVHPWPAYPRECYAGVEAKVCETRLGLNPALAGVKHLNRLEQVLARGELSGKPFREGIMRDVEGRVVCGTMSNVFVCTSGGLWTPEITDCGVRGIMRGVVMELARDRGIEAAERRIELEDMRHCDEVFFTNSLIGIWPAIRIDDRRYPVGAVTRSLMRDLANLGVGECAGPA